MVARDRGMNRLTESIRNWLLPVGRSGLTLRQRPTPKEEP